MTMAVDLRHGDCREVVRTLADASIDGVACDPPYALVSITSRFGAADAAPAKAGASGVYARASSGFMGQTWDTGDTAFDPDFWREVFRVLKPGAHVVAFGGTRTYHRLVCAIEDAGFEIRDQLAWIFGSGFPKSHDQGLGWGTALKPGFEPIVLARKPLSEGSIDANMARWGVGALNIDGCRVGERWPANVMHDGSAEVIAAFPQTKSGRGYAPYALGRESRPVGTVMTSYGDAGSAARFFYSPKVSRSERGGTGHPTVKPVAVMRWLCRLIAPPGAVILDPFAGSGTTGLAARAEGQRAILVEREAAYCGDILQRLARAA